VSADHRPGPLGEVVTEIRYAETGFQEEELVAAICGWAIERCGLRDRETAVQLDRDDNRYTFGMSALPRRSSGVSPGDAERL
jgi:hypothetical protein